MFDNPVLGTKRRWTDDDIGKWQEWDYIQGFVLPTGLHRPYRQKRAGMPYGLSVLVDPNVGKLKCFSKANSETERLVFLF